MTSRNQIIFKFVRLRLSIHEKEHGQRAREKERDKCEPISYRGFILLPQQLRRPKGEEKNERFSLEVGFDEISL